MPNYLINISGSSLTIELGPEIFETIKPAQAIIFDKEKYEYAYRYTNKNYLRELFVPDPPAPEPPDPPSKKVTLTATMTEPPSRHLTSNVVATGVPAGAAQYGATTTFGPYNSGTTAMRLMRGTDYPAAQANLRKSLVVSAAGLVPVPVTVEYPAGQECIPLKYINDVKDAIIPAVGTNTVHPIKKTIAGTERDVTFYVDDTFYGTDYSNTAIYNSNNFLVLYDFNSKAVEVLRMVTAAGNTLTFDKNRTLPDSPSLQGAVHKLGPLNLRGDAVTNNLLGYDDKYLGSTYLKTEGINTIIVNEALPVYQAVMMDTPTNETYYNSIRSQGLGTWHVLVRNNINIPGMATNLVLNMDYSDSLGWMLSPTVPGDITVVDDATISVTPSTLSYICDGFFAANPTKSAFRSEDYIYELTGLPGTNWMERIIMAVPNIIDILNRGDSQPITIKVDKLVFTSKSDLTNYLGAAALPNNSIYKKALAEFDNGASEVTVVLSPHCFDSYDPITPPA